MTEYSPAKTGEYPRTFPNFENCPRCEKDLKDNKDNSFHLRRKYPRIFVFGHYLFLVVSSFPRASLSENCSLLGPDNVRGQISEHIFAPNGGYCLYIFAPKWRLSCVIILQIFFATPEVLKLENIPGYSPVLAGTNIDRDMSLGLQRIVTVLTTMFVNRNGIKIGQLFPLEMAINTHGKRLAPPKSISDCKK